MVINSWEELGELKHDTLTIEVDLKYGNGWVRTKSGEKEINFAEGYIVDKLYLSTHTFYKDENGVANTQWFFDMFYPGTTLGIGFLYKDGRNIHKDMKNGWDEIAKGLKENQKD